MDQTDLLLFLSTQLNRLGIDYYITGSHATTVYGYARFTHDIDIVVELDETNVDDFCAAFPEDDFYLSQSAARQAVVERGMFNIIHPTSGLKIDVIVAKQTPFNQLRMQRSVWLSISDECQAKFSSPEDIIVHKLLWHEMGGGERHLKDIEGVVVKRKEKLDRQYIVEQTQSQGVLHLWQAVLEKISNPSD